MPVKQTNYYGGQLKKEEEKDNRIHMSGKIMQGNFCKLSASLANECISSFARKRRMEMITKGKNDKIGNNNGRLEQINQGKLPHVSRCCINEFCLRMKL